MILYTQPDLSEPAPCPYLPEKTLVYEQFFADGMSDDEMGWFLSRGWRKFGHYFFRPACPGCQQCIPLRIDVDLFAPSRSQRRVLRKCSCVQVDFTPIRYSRELFDIYDIHSRNRFNEDHGFEHFAYTLLASGCRSTLSRYWLAGRLVGAGFLDIGNNALSSVYFVYDTSLSALSLGVYSVLQEIEETRRRGLKYYYLGYIVPGCAKMDYKGTYRPHQLYSWNDSCWFRPRSSTDTGKSDNSG